jgi:hypothetical protein
MESLEAGRAGVGDSDLGSELEATRLSVSDAADVEIK